MLDETAAAPVPIREAFAVGSQVGGRYRIVRSLGIGGMGEVFEVEDLVVGTRVALKALRSDRTAPTMIERLRRELALARKVTHRNVCRIHDLGDHEGRVFLTMELLDGETLAERIRRGRLDLAGAQAIVDQLVLGLAAAHAAGIVHRDFKSANVVLVGGERPRAVVTDFGLARSAIAGEHTDLTGDATMLGTAAYMAPEQVEGKPVTAATDIYALGVVMFEMLTGGVPFRGDTPLATASARLTSDPPSASSLRPDVSAAWDSTIGRCLARVPGDRFARVEDVASSLRGSDETRSFGTSRAVPRRSARRTFAIGAIAAVAIAGSVAVGYSLRETSVASIAPPPATPPAPSPSLKFTPLTFRRGTVISARFTPDGSGVIYSASWDGEPITTYLATPGRPETRTLFEPGTLMRSIAADGRIALTLKTRASGIYLATYDGTLAIGTLAGEAPRPISDAVIGADWAPTGDKPAVIRPGLGWAEPLSGVGVVEFPYGRKVLEHSAEVTDLRVSRDGKRLAVTMWENSQILLSMFDAAGKRSSLVSKWRDIRGIAWSPDDREVWFTGSPATGTPQLGLYAVDLRGNVRELLRVPASLFLHDVRPDGRVLLSRDTMTHEAGLRTPTGDRSLSWFDFTFPMGISKAGDAILFNEQGAASVTLWGMAFLRLAEERTPVKLFDMPGLALSPDGTRFLAFKSAVSEELLELVLLPTGAGEPRVLPRGPLVIYQTDQAAAFSPDGNQIVFVGRERVASRARIYLQDLDGGEPRPITPWNTGITDGSSPLSADGWVFARDRSNKPDAPTYPPLRLFAVDGRPTRDTKNMDNGTALRWAPGGRILFARPDERGIAIHTVDPITGDSRELYKLSPPDRSGVETPPRAVVTPDGKTAAYSYLRRLSQLYIVEGLR